MADQVPVAGPTAARSSLLKNSWERHVLLRPQEAAALNRPEDQTRLIQQLHAGVRRRLEVWRGTADDEGLAPAGAAALREALLLATRAALVAEGRSADPLRRTWDEALEDARAAAASDASVIDAAATLLDPRDPLALDAVVGDPARAEDSMARLDAVATLTSRLAAQHQVKTIAQVRAARIGRLALVALSAAALLAALAWSVRAALRAPNVARGKPVSVSKLHHESIGVEGVTNGVLEPTFAAATAYEPDGWMKVDLLASYRLSEISVAGRGDGGWAPGVVELAISEDDREYRVIATRSEPFFQSFPWSVSLRGDRARYVRLRPAGGALGLVAISEIEVRGRP